MYLYVLYIIYIIYPTFFAISFSYTYTNDGCSSNKDKYKHNNTTDYSTV